MGDGRCERSLAERIDYVRATEVAASIGQGLALVFGLVGLLVNPWLIFIALFVWMGASAEATAVGLRGALAGVPVSRAMMTDFRTVRADSPLRDAVSLVLMGAQRDFPVVSESRDQIVGILSRDQLLAGLSERGSSGVVRDAMTTEFETADAREMLIGAFSRLQRSTCPVLPVMQDGRLVGLLTSDNVGEFVMIRGALKPGRKLGI